MDETGRRFEVEEVDAVARPPRARVDDAVHRKIDYLEGFLSQKPAESDATEPGGDLQATVVDALKEIFDPEIPVNIYDLGLIYDVIVSPEAGAGSNGGGGYTPQPPFFAGGTNVEDVPWLRLCAPAPPR